MPKVDIDYSNTIFYKIYCKNPSVDDIYIGHTTNFVQRKYAHKRACLNNKSMNHHCKLYKVIRENDGWKNWNMEIIAFHTCDDHYSARKQEQHYFEEYKATLNSIEPFPKPKIKPEKKPEKKPENILTEELFLEKVQKGSKIYECKLCNYTNIRQSQFDRHILTTKHQNRMIKINKVPKSPSFSCVCGKKYTARNSLWYHKNKCLYEPPSQEIQNTNENNIDYKDMFLEMMKENRELHNTIKEIMTNVMKELTINKK